MNLINFFSFQTQYYNSWLDFLLENIVGEIEIKYLCPYPRLVSGDAGISTYD